MTSVEQAFRPAFTEIKRRQDASKDTAASFCKDTTYFTPSGESGVRATYDLPDQEHVLVSMGTAVLAPRPVDASNPSLRVYGAFADKEEARDHADVVRSVDPGCSLVIVPRDQWVLMPQNEAVRDDPELASRRCAARLDAHREAQVREDDVFFNAVAEQRSLSVDAPAQSRDHEEEEAETREAEDLVYKPPRRLRAGADVRGQQAVCMCVLRDLSGGGECMFRVLGCFENTDRADTWARNAATRRITDHDVCVAPTGEWIFPNAPSSSTSVHYRNDELQRIMDAADRNPEAVKTYKQWKKDQDEARARARDESVVEEVSEGGGAPEDGLEGGAGASSSSESSTASTVVVDDGDASRDAM